MRSLKIGRYRQRVTVQAQVGTTKDSFGQTTPIWANEGTYWAEVMPTRARDLVSSGQVKTQISHTVRIRYPGPDVELGPAKHRLVLKDRILNIIGFVNVEERNRFYELTCQEIEV